MVGYIIVAPDTLGRVPSTIELELLHLIPIILDWKHDLVYHAG